MMPNGNQPSPDCAISSPLQSTASIFRTSPCNPKSGAVDHRPYGPYGAIWGARGLRACCASLRTRCLRDWTTARFLKAREQAWAWPHASQKSPA